MDIDKPYTNLNTKDGTLATIQALGKFAIIAICQRVDAKMIALWMMMEMYIAKNADLIKMNKVKNLQLGMTVYHIDIYWGREPMKVVGIRQNQVELQGDYSGGTHNVLQSGWKSIEGVRITPPETP